ncbi:MAG: hypothetical protein K6B64_01435 [Acholeplasmatales bacterium]|nr:hypothetical protein [Acholeplasmatales bacterium]
MRKFQNASETEDLLDELLEGIELNTQVEEVTPEKEEEKGEEAPKPERFDKETLPVVLERLEAGLIGSLRIAKDKSNKPIIKDKDIIQLRRPNRLLPKDFVFYKIEDEYFLRRIIKFKEDDIYVAGDNEREYHVIHKENIIAKVVGRERGKHFTSFSFTAKNNFYTFRKVNLAFFRLGNRVRSFEQEQNAESLEAAMKLQQQQAQQEAQKVEAQTVISADIDLDSDLAAFLDPDDLVRELREEAKEAQNTEEEVIYVDEYGNEIKDYKPEQESEDKGKFMQGPSDEDEFEDEEEPIEDEEVSESEEE